jgi:hypothetical protein
MGSEMHKDQIIINDDASSSGIIHRGVLSYYLGSVFFMVGIALLAIGVAFIMILKIHYNSLPEEILLTAVFMGVGVTSILTGINLMMRQTKYGYDIVGVSAFMSLSALSLFVYAYPHKWYYPFISYVFLLFVAGFLVLMGNAFANVTLKMIGNRFESVVGKEEKAEVKIYTDEEIERDIEVKIYTDEEIERDIEEATRKSVEAAVNKLDFTMSDAKDLTLGASCTEVRGSIVRVKDDIDEARILRITRNPIETDKWGSIGIDKVSMQLSSALENQPPIEKDRLVEITKDFERKIKGIVDLVKSK